MNLITHRFSIDLEKMGSQVVLTGLKIGDTCRAIDVSLSVNGVPYPLGAEHAARIRVKIETEEETVLIDEACEIKNSRVFYKINPEILSIPGLIAADLEIGDLTAEIFSTARFMFFVTDTVSDDTNVPEDAYNSVITALAKAQTAEEKSIQNVEIDEEGILTFTLLDGTSFETGNVIGPQGPQGEQGPPGQIDYSGVANALKGTASGSAVAMKDVSPLDHEIAVTLLTEETIVGAITNADNADFGGTYGDYVIEAIENVEEYSCEIRFTDGLGLSVWQTTDLTVSEISVGDTVRITDFENEPGYWYALLVKPGFSGDVTSITLTKYGKNLFPLPYKDGMSKTVTGVTFTVNTDGSITIEGTNTSAGLARFDLTAKLPLDMNQTYTASAKGLKNANFRGLNNVKAEFDGKSATFKPSANYVEFFLYVRAGVTVSETVYPMLEIGTSETEYEPYKAPTTYTPNADGTVDGVTSLYPSTTLVTDSAGVTIKAEYSRDINKAFAELQALIANA